MPNLIILSQVVAENFLTEDLHMHFIGVRVGKIENLNKKVKLTSAILFYFNQYTWPPSGTQAPIEAEKYVTEILLERKRNGKIQELISNMWLILCYTVQLVISNVCTKFQSPKSSSFREIFDGKKSLQTD